MAEIPVEEFKADLRKTALAKRDALTAEFRQSASEAAAAFSIPIGIGPQTIVSGFVPIRTEINPAPLMRRLAERGARLALPAIAGKGRPLVMRSYAFGDPLIAGVWGIREPRNDAAEVWPDVMIVPLLAFDRKGHRIGYGAGYYDMTINRLRLVKPVVAIGLAYSSQQVGVVPATARDARLDLVVTEREVIECRRL